MSEMRIKRSCAFTWYAWSTINKSTNGCARIVLKNWLRLILSGTVFNAKEFLDGLLKPKAREEQIMNRFTERAKGILEDAMRFALDKGHDHVGTEHILLALLNVENCFAKKILEKLGIDNQAVIKSWKAGWSPLAALS